MSMRVSAIVMAAGESKRMGRAKQTLPFGNSTILGTVIERLAESEVDGITVVLGRDWEQVYPVIQHLTAEVVVNPRPELGMLSTAQWGLAHLREDADAFLFALGDQPQLQPATVNALLRAAAESARSIFLPAYRSKRGHPLLVKARHKSAILALPHSGGLNQLMENHPEDILEVEVASPAVLADIDTPEDYRRARESPAD